MNARIKYLTSATFLIILQLLIIKELWVLALVFGALTIVYLLLEFNGMRPRYFFRTSLFVLIVCTFTFQHQLFLSNFVQSHVELISNFSGERIVHYVMQGLGILGNIL